MAFSLLFYAWGSTWFVAVMAASIFMDYIWGVLIAQPNWRSWGSKLEQLDPDGPRSFQQKLFISLSVLGNLSLLAFFKYFNFGVDSYNSALGFLGLDSLQWHTSLKVLLPIGISFFTFQSMSYTIDVYRGNTSATRNLLNFATFVALFPQLIAGPIVRYRDVAQQLLSREHSLSRFAYGVKRFAIGLGKKVLIANIVAVPADAIFGLESSHLTFGLAWMGVVCYTLQIYFDFSGYSDMAIGLGHMFGFKFLENFNYPYISRSVREFWRRWHISLSSWFRDYLYFPLGGNRLGDARTYFNLVTVFFLCGLWHGAKWNFVAWGLYHGLFLVLERTRVARFLKVLPSPLQHAYALLVVMVGWVLFRSETLPYAGHYLLCLLGLASATNISTIPREFMTGELAVAVFAGLIGATPLFPAIRGRLEGLASSQPDSISPRATAAAALTYDVWCLAMLVICSLWLAAGTHNPFIYFRF